MEDKAANQKAVVDVPNAAPSFMEVISPMEQTDVQNRIAPFLPLVMAGLLCFMLWFVSTTSDEQWKNSLSVSDILSAKMIYIYGGAALLYSAGFVLFADRVLKMKTQSGSSPSLVLLYALTELPMLLGFVTAFLNQNSYLAVPFVFLGLALYVHAFSLLRENRREP